jgi:hypothetical protein
MKRGVTKIVTIVGDAMMRVLHLAFAILELLKNIVLKLLKPIKVLKLWVLRRSRLLRRIGRYFKTHPRQTKFGQVLAGFLLLFFVLRLGVSASDLNKIWDFSNQSFYTLSSSNDLEYSGSSVRLKAQNYSSDANTAALYHLDEASGSSVTDSSSNSNTATTSNSPSWDTGKLNNGLTLNGTTQSATAPDSSSLSISQANTVESWVKPSSSFSANASSSLPIADKGSYKLYLDKQTGKPTYELANSSATSWTQEAGSDIKGSWDLNGKNSAQSSVVAGSNMYIGTGTGVGDAEVWKYNGTSWSQIGGDALNSGWAAGTYESVTSLATDGTNIYAGLGLTAGDAEVWKYNGSSWTKIGGDTLNSSWANSTYTAVYSMTYFNSTLYAGLGSSSGAAEVWRWNGTFWVQIGGDGLGSSWATSNTVNKLENDGTNLYAGLATPSTAGGADLWKYNGSSWSQIGGDGLNSSWTASTYEEVLSIFYQDGSLYVGIGTGTGDAEVWKWNGSAWSRLAYSGSSFPAATYQGIYSLSGDGTNIYAGAGNGSSNADVWKYNGSTWTQIGGDGLNSGWTGTSNWSIPVLAWFNSKLYADIGVLNNGDVMHSYNGSVWTREAGQNYNGSWGFNGFTSVQSMATNKGKLYAGMSNNGGSYPSVYEYDGSTWRIIGSGGLNSGWTSTQGTTSAMVSAGGNLYVGLSGSNSNDADIWMWNGSSWSQVGGDGLNSSWSGAGYQRVASMTSKDGVLYAGVGSSVTQNADVWKYQSGSWTRIGGAGVNSGWNAGYRVPSSLSFYNGDLYAGMMGINGSSTDLYKFNGTTWAQVAGDGLNSSWNTPSLTGGQISSLTSYGGKLYAGLDGNGNLGYTSIWSYDGSTWSEVAGDSVNGSWDSSVYDRIYTVAEYNGDLYAGLGSAAGSGDVWKFNGSSWTQVGGDGLNGSWSSNIETVSSLQTYQGKIYAGTGNTVNIDAMVYSYGNNGFLQGSTTSLDTNWHHLAASYDGSNMKIYVDGTLVGSKAIALTIPDNAYPLRLGSMYASTGGNSEAEDMLAGSLDEIRISSVARTSFTTAPYNSERVAVRLTASEYTSGIASWDGLSSDETTNGGTITYRLSDDGGTSWKFWNGSSWSESFDLSQSNSISDINSHISTFPVGAGGVTWQAVLDGDGNQRVQLNSVSLAATSDTTPPSANAADIVMKKSPSGSSVSQDDWTNAEEPYFSWTPANDSQSNIQGYCLYLGTDNTADPVTSKGLLGSSPLATNDLCQFMIASSSIDLSTSGYLATALTSSNSKYYLKIKAVDAAGNVYSASSASFSFKFDNTQPVNPLFVSTPSQFLSTKQATITWPTADSNAASDTHSGVAGLQYKIGSSGTWYGDGHTGSQDSSDLLTNDGSYQTTDPPDFDNLDDGNNTVYFRTYDNAGNVTTTYVTGVIKINTSSPTGPQNVTATPESNTVNSFAFSWQAPASFFGSADNLTYCYTINTTPTANTCNFTAAGVTSLSAGAYATQPGENTFYVVAKDEAGNINYATAAHTTFNANTSAPGLPRNVDIVDISVKSTSNWRLALSWDEPEDVGAGVASYKIYRSTDDVNFSSVASTAGTSYVDSGLTQQDYYYKVKACDSANNCGALSSSVTEKPTGKYTTPATLSSEPKVSNISTRKATINWATDRDSDSRIQYGLKSGEYFSTEAAISAQVTSHEVQLNNLTAGTTYYAKARWTDEDGNTGQSSEFVFKTAAAPTVKEVESNPSLTGADIKFTSKDASKVKLYYGKTESFGGTQTLNTSLSESSYDMSISGLDDGVKYFFKLNTLDSDGNEYEGNVYSFTTPPRPRISNLRFQPVKDQPSSTQKVSWQTNVPATSELSYGIGSLGSTVVVNKSTTNHEITIKGLKDDSNYILVARSRDSSGNLAVSDQQTFKTDLDTRPPKISEVVVDASIRGTGSEARGQVVVSWKTDEPSTSQVAYGEGSTGFLSSSTSEDAKLTTDHVVVVSELSTSRVYHFEPRSFDQVRNQAKGEQKVAIIGRASENVLSIIFNALQKIFGIN